MPPDNNDSERKMPAGKRFQPGVSGNPGGRPKKLKEFQQALYDRFYEKSFDVMESLLTDEDGRVRAAGLKELYDRIFGKSPQAITGADGTPLLPSSQEMNERIASILAGRVKQD